MRQTNTHTHNRQKNEKLKQKTCRYVKCESDEPYFK